MNILIINTSDIGGGAEHDAWNLLKSYKSMGHNCWMVVKKKHSNDSDILEIPDLPLSSKHWCLIICILRNRLKPYEGRVNGIGRLRAFLRSLEDIHVGRELRRGLEDFYYPGTARIPYVITKPPNIIHAHNLHGGFFDLRVLPEMNQKYPLFITLHDMWLITGHCAHSFSCDRWKYGCGECPDITIYPAISKDATELNWQRKRDIYSNCNLYISTPSRWLMEKVKSSILNPAIQETKVIPYGVDLDIFNPGDYNHSRRVLGIPADAFVFLFVAQSGSKNPFKDFPTLWDAVQRIATANPASKITFLILGEANQMSKIGNSEVIYIPFQSDPQKVANYYQAADVYLHAARADNFPLTILEALSCGTPVVATAVGGIPEQIRHGETGFLTPQGDAESIALYSMKLLQNNEFRIEMGLRAAKDAHLRFDINREVDTYLDWYQEVLDPLR